jgi:hypothetical protein
MWLMTKFQITDNFIIIKAMHQIQLWLQKFTRSSSTITGIMSFPSAKSINLSRWFIYLYGLKVSSVFIDDC